MAMSSIDNDISSSCGAEAQSLAEQAYRAIEDMVVRLDLPPGSRLTENDLSQRVGFGRTPVREALQRLHYDGLVRVFPRKGIAVSEINPLDVLVALDVCVGIERLVAVSAARRVARGARAVADRLAGVTIAEATATGGPSAVAEQLTSAMAEAARTGDVAGFVDADKAIDRLLADLSGNPYAARALMPLQAMARRAWLFFRRASDLVPAARRHEDLLRAVCAADAAAADAAAEALIAHLRESIKEAVSRL